MFSVHSVLKSFVFRAALWWNYSMLFPDATPAAAEEATLHFVIFRAAGQHFAVPIQRVQEIVAYQKVTPLLQTSDLVEGVIDLRGRLVPVVDLRKQMRIPVESPPKRILVLRVRKQAVGLGVDHVLRVFEVPVREIQEPPAVAATNDPNFVIAVVRHQNDLCLVLDLESLLGNHLAFPGS